MNLQKFVDTINSNTCIMSVEKKNSGKEYGAIRIVCGNKAYHEYSDILRHKSASTNVEFIPNQEYERYIDKDINFENACYNCAILGEPQHAYVHPTKFDMWFEYYMMPLESDDPDIGYCTYSMQYSNNIQASHMADVSSETASDVLNTCIKLRGAKDFNKTLSEVVEDIRIICDASYCCVLSMDNKNRASYLLSESIINDSSLVPSSVWFTEEFYDIAASWEKTLNGSNCLIIASDHDYEYIKSCNPTWYSSLKDAEVHSLALYPLLSGNEIIGYIWARDFDTSRTSRIKSTLELTSFFLASELQSKNLMDRLSEMSTTDMLTGVFNRNSMNNRVDYILGNNGQEPIDISSIGIIYVDLNGLKKANDEDGHAAGDLILKDSASRICEIVPDGEIYRAGGDEFVVFIVNTTENAVKEYYQKLEECSVYEGKISFAVGYSFAENPQKIVSALHEADSKMYSNKESYYKTHPDKAR